MRLGADDDSKPETATATPVYIEAKPLRSHILNGIVSKIPVLIDVRVKAEEKKNDTRTAFELAVVLDRSGSMSGDKLAKCKVAILHILDNLTANDVVHFVIYDDNVETVFSDGNVSQRDELKDKVQKVTDGGCTNLHGGMMQGYHLMVGKELSATAQTSDEIVRQKRIFLFSDGLVNSGVKDPQQIFEETAKIRANGINVSTFGVGTDFDEKLMKGIAEYGCGDYMYIEQSEDIEKKVAKALRGLVSMVGTEAKIQFRGLNGSLIEKIHGNSDESLRTGVMLRDLRENDWKRLVLFMEIRPPSAASAQNSDILSYKLVYQQTRPAGDTHSSEAPKSVTIEGRVSVEFTDDESQCAKEDPVVAAAVAVVECAVLDQQVLKELERGNRTEAIRLKKQAVELLQEKAISSDLTGALRLRTENTLRKLEDNDVSTEHAKKEVGWDMYAEEEDCDMGYALFD